MENFTCDDRAYDFALNLISEGLNGVSGRSLTCRCCYRTSCGVSVQQP